MLWRVGGFNGRAVPVADSHRVYFATAERSVVAVDRVGGRTVWTTQVASAIDDDLLGFAGSVVAGSNVVVVRHEVVAISRATGSIAWRRSVPNESFITSPPAVSADTIFVASSEGVVRALSAEDGRILWGSNLVPFQVSARGLSLVGQYLVAGWTRDARGGLAVLERRSGRIKWVREFQPLRDGVTIARCLGGAVGDDATLFVSTRDGTIYALDTETGAERWHSVSRLPPDGVEDDRRLAVAGELLLASSFSGWIEARHVGTGNIVWTSYANRGSVTLPPAIVGAHAVIVHAAGQLTALDLSNGKIVWRGGESQNDLVAPAISAPLVTETAMYYGGVGALVALGR